MKLARGDAIGEYRLEEPLGRGGSAEVWRATDPGSGRAVALKVALTAEARDALAREAAAGARLDHPRIAKVLAARLDADPPHVVVELVPGPSLRAHLRQGGALAPAAARAVFDGILEALAHAHARGVAHLDLKPENVILAPTGPVVSDFGCAARIDPDALALSRGLDTSEAVAGTAAYIAPERLEGGPGTPSADVYALGAIWFELVTGRLPQGSATPSEVAPGLGPGEDRIFLLCYTAEHLRPRDAGALARALAGDPLAVAIPVAPPPEPPRTLGSSPVAIGFAVLGGLLVASVAFAALFFVPTRPTLVRAAPPAAGPVRTAEPLFDARKILEEAKLDVEERTALQRHLEELAARSPDWAAAKLEAERWVRSHRSLRHRYDFSAEEPWSAWATELDDGEMHRIRVVSPEDRRARARELDEFGHELRRLRVTGVAWPAAKAALEDMEAKLGERALYDYTFGKYAPWSLEACARAPDAETRLVTAY